MGKVYTDKDRPPFKGKLTEAGLNWNAVNNAIVKFTKHFLKKLEKAVKNKDETETKKLTVNMVDGLQNAVRSLKLEGKLTEKKSDKIWARPVKEEE